MAIGGGKKKSNPVASDTKKSILPGFLGGKGDNKAGKKAEGLKAAADDLKAAEDDIADRTADESGGEDLDDVRKNEEEAGGLYKGTGKASGKDVKGGFKSKLKKGGPIGAILALILAFGGTSFLSLSSELVAWKENLSSMYGQNSAVMNRRGNFLMKRLLRTNYDTTSTGITGKTKFKITSKLTNKLSAQGIDYVEVNDANGTKMRMLVFEDSDGNYVPVVASDDDLPRARAISGSEVDLPDGRRVKLDTDASMTLSTARKVNTDFEVAYDTATATFTGKIAGWFDNMADSLFDRIIGKNARHQTDNDDLDEEGTKRLLLGNASDGVDNNEIIAETEETDGEGNKTYRPVDADDEIDVGDNTRVRYGDIESEDGRIRVTSGDSSPGASAVESSLSARAKKAAMMSSTAGCAILKGMGAISAAIGAVQVINTINYASKYLESADRIKDGSANKVTNYAIDNLHESTTIELDDMDGKTVSVTGSVVDGAGWNTAFSSKNIVDENDPSSLAVNRELANKHALKKAMNNNNFGSGAISSAVAAVSSWGSGVAAFRACNAIQGVAGVVSAVADVVSLFTFGIAKVVKDTVQGAIKGAALAAAMIVISAVITAITPTIAHWFAGLLSDVFLGKTGSYALLSGAQNIMNSNLQMSTGRYADRTNAIQVFALTKEVEVEWAAYERATKSPLDVTSKYTFLGSIYNSMIPLVHTFNNNATSTIAAVSTLASLTNTSVVSLVSPSVSAADEISEFSGSLASEGNCAYLQSVGVAGDFACNKYAGAYVDQLESLDPDDVYDKMKNDYGSFSGEYDDGNPKINPKSRYAKYIVACITSDTQPGTMNGAVQGLVTGVEKDIYDTSVLAGSLVSFGRNFIPFEGFLDAAESVEDESNVKWNSGLACTGNTNDEKLNEEVMYYSTFNLDQREFYNMGVVEENSTYAFLEDYYKENPLDYSFEGQIARVSGMTKEEVNDTLGLIEYIQFVDEYDSSTRYAFGAPVVEEMQELKFDNDNSLASEQFILLNQISFADIRNRTFAV